MKKTEFVVTLVFVAVLAFGAVTGCGKSDTKKSTDSKKENTVVRIAAQPYPLYTPVYVAKNLGFLDEELKKVGAECQWSEFKSGPLVNEAVAAGEADLGFMADLPAIIAKSTGQDIEVVSNVAYGEKGLAVLVKSDSDITSIKDLKGKKVAYATGSYAQHLLALLLDKEGLSLNDVESINLAGGDQPAALTNGEVDAIVIWEQFISQLTSSGEAKVLADGTGIKRGNMITYFVKKYAEQNPDVVKAYIRALNRANEVLKSDPDKAAKTVAGDFDVEEGLMKKIIANFDYHTELTKEDIDEITKVKDFSLQSGIISSDVNIDEFITTKYLDEIAKEK